ncbi:MAG: alkaline phosphatase [Akkermansiaceae bacterium]|jgi:alkaline phosphatase|nr:alkaline phosphatase [Akkermansiaceae bacterium]MDP4647352.1 alkaline phosphatase [Akkermansiaceae bacterium]MDP4720135.1 alkaline phosphatase [Akkermansiaceae bacterium]MDP4779504.1 alkaline phosphatase [Akkermansiaceae bacterium]MDP4847322.1 alkaline phosphatase [Akkermansiaceae bacterium]
MPKSSLSRRDLLKLGGATAILSGCKSKAQANSPPEVKGVIFMVSDGMSHGVLTMAENFSNIVHGKGTHWWKLIDNNDATHGLMETSSANSMVTDSAAASSAWGGGVKINNTTVNVRPDGTESLPIMRQLKQLGHKTALVSTASITHATPAGFAAVTPNRDDEHLIAPQYLGVVDIILGGGMKFFDPRQRVDSRDAILPYQESGYDFLQDRDSLLKSKSEKLLGLFGKKHMEFEVDRLNDKELKKSIPTLAEMSEVALKRLLPAKEKFLIQIEGGRIDHGAHLNDIAGLLWDQLAFDDAIGKVLEMIQNRDDILLIVTSDHGNANPGLNGTGVKYKDSDEAFKKITRITSSHEKMIQDWRKQKSKDPVFLTTFIRKKLGITLTPEETQTLLASLTSKPFTEWSNQLSNPQGILGQIVGNHTGIGWTGTSHTSDPTIISAFGSQSDRFHGITPNQEIHRHLLELLA